MSTSPNNVLNKPAGPIGAIYMGDGKNVSASNPNGWQPSLMSGAITNHGAVINYISSALVEAKKYACPILHIHDIEGYSQTDLTYVGDPFMVFDTAGVGLMLDWIFGEIKAVGLKASITLRHTCAQKSPDGLWSQQESDGGGADFLVQKAVAAVNRWPGIGAIYVDSNWSPTVEGPIVAQEMAKCINALPNVFWMFEHYLTTSPGYLPYMGAPYIDMDGRPTSDMTALLPCFPCVIDFSRLQNAQDPAGALAAANAAIAAGHVKKFDLF